MTTVSSNLPVAVIGAGPVGLAAAAVAHAPSTCCTPRAESFLAPLSVAAPHAVSSCCGGPAPAGTEACCVLDAQARAAGKAGCGCNDSALAQQTTEPDADAATIAAVPDR